MLWHNWKKRRKKKKAALEEKERKKTEREEKKRQREKEQKRKAEERQRKAETEANKAKEAAERKKDKEKSREEKGFKCHCCKYAFKKRACKLSSLKSNNSVIDINTCCVCGVLYSDDRTGKDWIECVCGRWLHEDCAEDCILDSNGKERFCPMCF